jgi:hypothetical protein
MSNNDNKSASNFVIGSYNSLKPQVQPQPRDKTKEASYNPPRAQITPKPPTNSGTGNSQPPRGSSTGNSNQG